MKLSRLALPAILLASTALPAQMASAWEHDYAAAVKRAKAEHKLVLLDLWAEWCGPCQYLKNQVFPTAEAQTGLRTVVPLSEMVQTKDGTDIAEGKRLAERYGLQAFPTLILVDGDGNEVARHVGSFRTGAELSTWIASHKK